MSYSIEELYNHTEKIYFKFHPQFNLLTLLSELEKWFGKLEINEIKIVWYRFLHDTQKFNIKEFDEFSILNIIEKTPSIDYANKVITKFVNEGLKYKKLFEEVIKIINNKNSSNMINAALLNSLKDRKLNILLLNYHFAESTPESSGWAFTRKFSWYVQNLMYYKKNINSLYLLFHPEIENQLNTNHLSDFKTAVLKQFERGELKKKCLEYAKKNKLEKGTELTQETIDLISNELTNEGYKVNLKSIGSKLRDLGYRKEKY